MRESASSVLRFFFIPCMNLKATILSIAFFSVLGSCRGDVLGDLVPSGDLHLGCVDPSVR